MSDWTPKEVATLISLYNEGKRYIELADFMGKSKDAIDSKIRHMRKKGDIGRRAPDPKAMTKPVPVKLPPGQQAPTANDEEVLVYSNEFLVAGDFHIPGQSDEWIDKLLQYGVDNKIPELFIAGDFWNFDAVSRWQLKDPALSLKVEIKRGKEIVDRLREHFVLYFVCGNHDSRLPRALNYTLNFNDWMEALFGDTVVTTNYDYIKAISGDKTFRICHPGYYSVNKGSQVALLAQDLQENIIMGHQHFASISTNKTGQFICIDLGCMCDANKFYYKKSATTRYPRWENGFVHIKDGNARMICDYSF